MGETASAAEFYSTLMRLHDAATTCWGRPRSRKLDLGPATTICSVSRRRQRAAKPQHVGEVSVNRKSYSFVILASERCSDYLCDFAATGFVLDPAGNSGAGIYCERCGRKMVAEYCEKVEPGWTFHPGKIHGDLAERPPAAPEPPESSASSPEQDDCSFLSYVEDRLTS